MSHRLFSLKGLHLLGDGTLETDFDAALASLVKDCTSRPSIEKTREVKILVRLVPKRNQDGTCDDIFVSVQVATKAPAKIVDPYLMRATVNGGLKYQPESPGNPDQSGLGFQ